MRMTSEALTVRRQYENRLPLGKADWTGPEPQPSHSALTRQIFFLEHRMLDGLNPATVDWLKRYAAEQHLWGTYWQLPSDEVPASVQAELGQPGVMDGAEGAYWKAYQMGLYVDNQETWRPARGETTCGASRSWARTTNILPRSARRRWVRSSWSHVCRNCRIRAARRRVGAAVDMSQCWIRLRKYR